MLTKRVSKLSRAAGALALAAGLALTAGAATASAQTDQAVQPAQVAAVAQDFVAVNVKGAVNGGTTGMVNSADVHVSRAADGAVYKVAINGTLNASDGTATPFHMTLTDQWRPTGGGCSFWGFTIPCPTPLFLGDMGVTVAGTKVDTTIYASGALNPAELRGNGLAYDFSSWPFRMTTTSWLIQPLGGAVA
jgi:hypothetical protein